MKAIEVFDRETNRYICVTPWFDGSVKPARPGVYQRDYPSGPHYSHWDGARWSIGNFRLREVQEMFVSARQALPWRGLAEQPE